MPMKILVTAGPTRERIDPVRFISNRSSGKMGYAIAVAAFERGHEVILVSGPVSLPSPAGMTVVKIESAVDMLNAVTEHFAWCNALVMAAAVCDWRPAAPSLLKMRKDEFRGPLLIERTPDILAAVAGNKGGRICVGFAAETGDPVPGAERKLACKKLDMIVANDVSATDSGFDADTNRAILISAEGTRQELPLMAKMELAGRIVDWIERTAQARS